MSPHPRRHRFTRTPPLARATPSVVAVAAAFHALAASAQSPTGFQLLWQAPPGCPTEGDVRVQLESLLGREAKGLLSVPLQVRGTVTLTEGGAELSLVRIDQNPSAQRLIAVPSCTDLDRAAAVVIALLLRKKHDQGASSAQSDQASVATEEPREPSPLMRLPEAEPASVAPPTPEPSPPATSAPIAPESTAFSLRLVPVRLDGALLPKPSLGAGLGLFYRHHRGRYGLAVSVDWSQEQRSGGSLSYASRFSRQSIEFVAAHGWRRGSFELSPAFVASVDRVAATASGDQLQSLGQTGYAPSMGPAVGGFWYAGGLGALSLSISGRILLQRPSFVVESVVGADVVHHLPWGTWVIDLGYEWIF